MYFQRENWLLPAQNVYSCLSTEQTSSKLYATQDHVLFIVQDLCIVYEANTLMLNH